MEKFLDLNINFIGRIFLLDVDGTLVEDSGENIEAGVIKKVNELKRSNTVYLCTNSRNKRRNSVIEERLGVKIVNLNHKKPSKKILPEVLTRHDKIDPLKLVVIGDKYLTDGVFAKNIGAKFIKVARITNGYEKIHIKLFNIMDDFVYNLVKLLGFVKS